MAQENQIKGSVEAVVFRNESNGYTILEVYSEDTHTVTTVVGTFPFVGEGESIVVGGEWVFHSEYGKQFRATSFEKVVPKDSSSILKYLSSGIIKGIGPKTAQKIVEKYGEDSLTVMSNHPEWLADFKGISSRKAVEISEQVRKQTTFYNLFDFCRDVLPMPVVLRLYNALGDDAINKLKADPYNFCGEINGYTFMAADAIAKENGYAPEGRERIYAATLQILKRAAETGGHSCLPVKSVISEVSELIDLEPKIVAEAEKEFALSGEIGYLHRDGGSLLYIPEYLSVERGIAGMLVSLDKKCIRYDFSDIEPMVRRVEVENGISFAAEQRKAIFEASRSGVMLITGGPGTGKTTIIKALIRIYKSMGCDIALAAPTGRAAKRMSEATSHEAKTLHRLLEVEFRSDDDERAVFVRNERNMLDEDIIIVDEVSMLDMFLLYSLLRAIRPGARLVLIGDCDQLPSVGAGNILRDLLESEVFNTVRLTEVFRQENESLIVTNAHRINNGEAP
ncbi:MAG: AAA family ATPase, partial [Clostridia bacterium]|nr:AAA family ATPase [Clostridia bacterium]